MNMMDFNQFESFMKASFPDLTSKQSEQFRMMGSLYREWNAKINVISRKDMDGLYDHHVLHSLAIAKYLEERCPDRFEQMKSPDNSLSVLDLGTGGGFPGIPLAIMFPEVKFTLCDSIKKKTIVASGIAESLGLGNVTVINARAETLAPGFDYVVSRAVASLLDFYPWVKGKYSQGILYLKGGDINEEISELMQRFRLGKGTISTWPVGSWLEDNYFDGKFVINIL